MFASRRVCQSLERRTSRQDLGESDRKEFVFPNAEQQRLTFADDLQRFISSGRSIRNAVNLGGAIPQIENDVLDHPCASIAGPLFTGIAFVTGVGDFDDGQRAAFECPPAVVMAHGIWPIRKL